MIKAIGGRKIDTLRTLQIPAVCHQHIPRIQIDSTHQILREEMNVVVAELNIFDSDAAVINHGVHERTMRARDWSIKLFT